MNVIKKFVPYMIIAALVGTVVATRNAFMQNTATVPGSLQAPAVTVTPTYEGCYFVWATHVLPDVSQTFNVALQKLGADISGSASAYGEDCVYADGHSTFSQMETDFDVTIKVQDANNEQELGNWIVEVMKVVDAFPPSPQPGRVTFAFEKDGQQQFLYVSVQDYMALPAGLSAAEVYRAFKK